MPRGKKKHPLAGRKRDPQAIAKAAVTRMRNKMEAEQSAYRHAAPVMNSHESGNIPIDEKKLAAAFELAKLLIKLGIVK